MKEITLVIRICNPYGDPVKEKDFFEQYCFPALMSNKYIYVKYEFIGSEKSGVQYLAVKKNYTRDYRKFWMETPSREIYITKFNNEFFSTKFYEFYIPGVKEKYGITSIHWELDRMNEVFWRTQIPSVPIHILDQ